jgi:hypothetical protein
MECLLALVAGEMGRQAVHGVVVRDSLVVFLEIAIAEKTVVFPRLTLGQEKCAHPLSIGAVVINAA